MSTIKIKTIDQNIEFTDLPRIYSGDIGTDSILFDFDEVWSGYIKTAVFYRKPDKPYFQVMKENECVIPYEVLLTPGKFYVGVVGVLDNKVLTSEVIPYEIYQGAITPIGEIVPEPSPDLWNQILDELLKIRELSEQMTQDQEEFTNAINQAFKDYTNKQDQAFEDYKTSQDEAFKNYTESQNQAFEDYTNSQNQAFNDYKTQTTQDLTNFKNEIEQDNQSFKEQSKQDFEEYYERLSSAGVVGGISMFAGQNAPDGYLLCQGQAISRTDYANLYNVIGTTYGSGDGTSTFNLPNLKGRVIVGLDGNDSDFNTLGKTGGTKAVTLTKEQIPAHNHGATVSINSGGAHTHSASSNTTGAHTHTLSGTAASAGSHRHGYEVPHLIQNTATGSAAYGYISNGAWDGEETYSTGAHTHSVSGTASSNGQHSHTITVNSGGGHSHTGTVSVANSGGGQAHNNLQPYIVLNYIIKY